MKSKLKFIFGNHCHQPVGNFDSVFIEGMEKSYRPFIELLQEFPSLKMSIHFSGCLLDWIENNQPDFLEIIAEMVSRGQLEVLSSGYYEPVLSAIPSWDRDAQLRQMNDYIQKRFGYRASGAWMTERVWESHIVDSLLSSGLRYIVIDDYHFKIAGLTEESIRDYYVTENDGKPLALFPIRESLRYAIPFEPPEKTIEILRSFYDKGHRLIVMIDDGEKFGMWPGTHKLSYSEGWVRRFFTALMENSDWLETDTPASVLENSVPTGTIYLPSASYFEMSEWTLPGDKAETFADIAHELQDSGQIERYRPYLHGGIWRNFLTKYPESNNMHKRMQSISSRIQRLFITEGCDLEKLARGHQHLLTAQCNCAYWHGVFGGLYLPHLRDAVYRELIDADQVADQVEYDTAGAPAVASEDVNLDGRDEAILNSQELRAIIAPAYGGALYELDIKELKLNLINTLASRKEGYHSRIQTQIDQVAIDGTASIHDINRNVDERITRELRYDWHNRYSFLDHFFPLGTGMETLRTKSARELGDFVNQPYTLNIDKTTAMLSRDGMLSTDGGQFDLTVSKSMAVQQNILQVDYEILYQGGNNFRCLFAPELNFSMLGGDDKKISYYSGKWSKQKMESSGNRSRTIEFGISDQRKGLDIGIKVSEPADFWFFPVRTVSQSESGFELNYQSSVVLPVWELNLDQDTKKTFSITIKFLRTSREM